jgi:hypothetical protein
VIRELGNIKVVTALLRAGHPVFIVTRTVEDDQRVLDLLSGWALGSGGDLDRIGPSTVLARPPDCPPIPIRRGGIASAIEEVFATDGRPQPLTRDEEERLLPQAIRGSESARRRIIDSYTELATLFALKIRPWSVSEAMAVRLAQGELDRLVRFPTKGPLLVSLVEGIIKSLVR